MVFDQKALEGRSAIIVWKIGGIFGLIVFEELEVFDTNDLVLISDKYPVDSVTVVLQESPSVLLAPISRTSTLALLRVERHRRWSLVCGDEKGWVFLHVGLLAVLRCHEELLLGGCF